MVDSILRIFKGYALGDYVNKLIIAEDTNIKDKKNIIKSILHAGFSIILNQIALDFSLTLNNEYKVRHLY